MALNSFFTSPQLFAEDLPVAITSLSSGFRSNPSWQAYQEAEPGVTVTHAEEAYENLVFGPGEAKALILDLGYRLQSPQLREGELLLELKSPSGEGVSLSSPVKADFRELSKEEREQLELLAGGSWPQGGLPRDWVTLRMNLADGLNALSNDLRDRLILYMFLSDVRQKGSPGLGNTDLLELFPQHLLGYAELLRYEVLRARDPTASSLAKSRLLDAYPELEWQVEQVDLGKGIIAKAIELKERAGVRNRNVGGMTDPAPKVTDGADGAGAILNESDKNGESRLPAPADESSIVSNRTDATTWQVFLQCRYWVMLLLLVGGAFVVVAVAKKR